MPAVAQQKKPSIDCILRRIWLERIHVIAVNQLDESWNCHLWRAQKHRTIFITFTEFRQFPQKNREQKVFNRKVVHKSCTWLERCAEIKIERMQIQVAHKPALNKSFSFFLVENREGHSLHICIHTVPECRSTLCCHWAKCCPFVFLKGNSQGKDCRRLSDKCQAYIFSLHIDPSILSTFTLSLLTTCAMLHAIVERWMQFNLLSFLKLPRKMCSVAFHWGLEPRPSSPSDLQMSGSGHGKTSIMFWNLTPR